MEHWWKVADEVKPKHFEKNLSQWHFSQHESHKPWPGSNPASAMIAGLLNG
jgi:hypothetical protein